MMNRANWIIWAGVGLGLLGLWYAQTNPGIMLTMHNQSVSESGKPHDESTKTAIVAGGCFWCVESDLEKIPGVLEAVSGYSGGESKNPTYENYSKGGHREVVEVTYDPAQVSYKQLLEYFLKHIDPTDGEGSFGDRGLQYSPAIYYENDEEREIAENVLRAIEERGVFEDDLAVPVVPREKFWPAEDYHQDYYKHHSLKYKFYRNASGRDRFIEKYWGDEAKQIPVLEDDAGAAVSGAWQSFEKPNDQELRQTLTPEQYKITQNEGTERPFDNEYWDNTEPGIYVDVVSGEPLYSSKDQYKSGTGWPSFSKPIAEENIVEKSDRSFFLLPRTEIRSKYGDSHLGHVFNDGPEPTGLRYCMNSAALRFIPKDKMEEEGYGDYLSFI